MLNVYVLSLMILDVWHEMLVLEEIVHLLLSHGAYALVMNDDCQTALDVAKAKGHSRVVRVIESHICLFSSWLRGFYGPGFLMPNHVLLLHCGKPIWMKRSLKILIQQ